MWCAVFMFKVRTCRESLGTNGSYHNAGACRKGQWECTRIVFLLASDRHLLSPRPRNGHPQDVLKGTQHGIVSGHPLGAIWSVL